MPGPGGALSKLGAALENGVPVNVAFDDAAVEAITRALDESVLKAVYEDGATYIADSVRALTSEVRQLREALVEAVGLWRATAGRE